MIIEEKNPHREARLKRQKIFDMLRRIKLPPKFKFISSMNLQYYSPSDESVKIKYLGTWSIGSQIVADITLNEEDSINVAFIDEEEIERMRKCFIESKTKFKLSVKENSYY